MIPNIIHFIFGFAPDFGKMPFSVVHYLAIRSAVMLNGPEAVLFHCHYEPAGEWWEKARPMVTVIRIDPPESIFGKKLYHFAHQSDVYRLQVLQQTGGIYLDLDTICVKPFTSLLHHSFVMGEESRTAFVPHNSRQRVKLWLAKRLGLRFAHQDKLKSGLCNAVILSEKGSTFAKRWLDEYRSFRSKGHDRHWNEHSVQVPLKLAARYPGEITFLGPHAFHYPLYDEAGLKALFEETHDYPEAYAHHLWESLSWNRYLNKLTEERIRREDTTYNLIARKYL